MENVFIGVDVGKVSGIGVVGDNFYQVYDYDSPQSLYDAMKRIVEDHHVVWAVKEKLWSMSKNGVKQGSCSDFTFGTNNGYVEMCFIALGIRYEEVVPRTWQKKMLKESDGQTTKERSLVMARRMFPNIDLKLKKHHNRSDALLLAAWKRYKELGL